MYSKSSWCCPLLARVCTPLPWRLCHHAIRWLVGWHASKPDITYTKIPFAITWFSWVVLVILQVFGRRVSGTYRWQLRCVFVMFQEFLSHECLNHSKIDTAIFEPKTDPTHFARSCVMMFSGLLIPSYFQPKENYDE
jgi:hypothetical protein